MSWAPFTFIPLLVSSYSSIGVTAHYLFLWGIKAFWVGKVAFSNFFTKDIRKGVVKNCISGALLLSYSFSLGTFSCSLLFFFFFFLTNALAPESKNLPWNHSKMCFVWRKKSLWSCGNVRRVLLRWKGKFANEGYGWCKVLQSWHAEGIWCKGSCQKSFLAQCNLQVSMAMKKIRKLKEPQIPTQLIKNHFYKHHLKHFSLSE